MATNAQHKERWATLSVPEKQRVCAYRFRNRPIFEGEELEKQFRIWLAIADTDPVQATQLDRLLGLATNEELFVEAAIEATQAARSSARAAKVVSNRSDHICHHCFGCRCGYWGRGVLRLSGVQVVAFRDQPVSVES